MNIQISGKKVGFSSPKTGICFKEMGLDLNLISLLSQATKIPWELEVKGA
ncbi:hypothetical protein Echvi_2029 [Echinicola vietnamensis DSM 17526]|uniref:Uncharacterized protein n=1 Tax=Echinicola vietnamensis (strain DSM 17526 / LMG 23754 / KMM 6221) TaxID=926556 RepID=L0FYA0_ECHVK|nr:hypothetical protein Echvi_2029 [Echinicola vietnamensis DSM 17526]